MGRVSLVFLYPSARTVPPIGQRQIFSPTTLLIFIRKVPLLNIILTKVIRAFAHSVRKSEGTVPQN